MNSHKGTKQNRQDRFVLNNMIKELHASHLSAYHPYKTMARMARADADDQTIHFYAQTQSIDVGAVAVMIRRYKDTKILGPLK